MMNWNDHCLTESEILEIASQPSGNEQNSAHVRECTLCHRAVERTRGELARIHQLFDPSIQANLDSIIPHQGKGGRGASRPQRLRPKLATNPLAIQPGSYLGKYRVKRLLGRGGLSEVFLVEHPELGIDLAAKLCRPNSSFASDDSFGRVNEAFLKQEAALLAKLADAKHIARVYDVAIDPNFGPYVIMEYFAARTLRQRMGEYASDVNHSIELIVKIADAVEEAHAKGIVHGDLKPENILIDDREQIKLIDFGMARIRDAWHLGESSEPHGGTPAYMSPEQARLDFAKISPASDVYALGTILHELLTGKRPSQDSTVVSAHSAKKTKSVKVPSPDALPFPWLHDVFLLSLAERPENRYPTSGAFAAAIRKNHFPGPPQKANLLPWLVGLTLLVVVVLAFSLPTIRRGSQALPVERIPGVLGAAHSPPGALEKSLPIQVGTKLRLSAVGPQDLQWFIAWIDGQRDVSVFETNDPTYPIDTQPVGDTRQVRIYWPDADKEVPIGGPGGTEMVLLIGVRDPVSATKDEIRMCINSVLSDNSSWPTLPDDVVVRCSQNDVQPTYADGSSRTLGQAVTSNTMQIENAIQQIRQTLKAKCDFVLGEAFTVSLP